MGLLGENLAVATPLALVLIGPAMTRDDRRDAFGDGMLELGLLLALAAGSAAQLGWTFGMERGDAAEWAARLGLAAALAVLVGYAAFRWRPRLDALVIATATGGPVAASLLALAVPRGTGPLERLVGALVYLALWSAVAATASRAGWRALFNTAIAMIALRLFLIYFELFYSLAFTGAGLMIGGVLLIALTWGWTRVVRRNGR
jgi:hypothetical protein